MRKKTIELTVPVLITLPVWLQRWWMWILVAVLIAITATTVSIFLLGSSIRNTVLAEETALEHLAVIPGEYLTEGARTGDELVYEFVLSNPDPGEHSYRLDVPLVDTASFRLAEPMNDTYRTLPKPFNFTLGGGDARTFAILATPQASVQLRVFAGCLVGKEFDTQKVSIWHIELR